MNAARAHTKKQNQQHQHIFCRGVDRALSRAEWRFWSERNSTNGGNRGGTASNGVRYFFAIKGFSIIIARLHRPVTAKMPADQNAIAETSPVARCALTNGKRKQLFGDGRSAGARRFRDLLHSFTAEFGIGTASNAQSLRRLAQISVELELLEAQRAAGDDIDAVDYTTLLNAQRRLLNDLEARKRASKPAPQKRLADYLAARSAQPATAA